MKYTALCLSGAALLLFCGCAKEQKKHAERSTRVETMKLEKRTFRQTIPVQGTVSPVEYATISAKISGTLENLAVSEGDAVKKGDTLFKIDQQVLKNQVTVKKDEIEVKKAALQSAKFHLQAAVINRSQAKADFDRALRLLNSKAVSQAEFERQETAYKKAEADVQSANAEVANAESQLRQAESNLAIAEKNLEDSEIKAPYDCIITETFIEENEFVSTGTKILKLENQQALEVVCHISAVYYDLISAGKTTVEFYDYNGNVTGSAPVSFKAPAIDPVSRTFKLKIAVPEKLPLQSGMLCEMKIILLEKSAYGIPSDAVLLRAGNRRIIYAAGSDNRAASTEVTIGITDNGYTEIVNAKDLLGKDLIISGQTFINNGSLLETVKRGEKK